MKKLKFYELYRTKIYQKNCILKNHCEDKNCNEFCKRCYSVNYLIYNGDIGKIYLQGNKLIPQNVDVEVFNRLSYIKENMEDWVRDGQNLLLRSKGCGNGKTSWSTKLLLNYFLQVSKYGLINDGLFINVNTLLYDIKENISTKEGIILEKLRRIMKADLIVWDDLGVARYTEYEIEQLWRLIDYRVVNSKSNIYTTNGLDCSIKDNIGPRLYSRIVNNSEVLEFKGADRRGGNKWLSYR